MEDLKEFENQQKFSCSRCEHTADYFAFLSQDPDDSPIDFLIICPNCKVLLGSFQEEIKEYTVNCSEEITFVEKVLFYIKEKAENPETEKLLEHAMINLKYHPLLPSNDICISFRQDDISFYLCYSHYKLELSDYVSENSGYGYDHYQRYKFYYTPEGETETTGEFYDFEYEFWSALESLPFSEISIGDGDI